MRITINNCIVWLRNEEMKENSDCGFEDNSHLHCNALRKRAWLFVKYFLFWGIIVISQYQRKVSFCDRRKFGRNDEGIFGNNLKLSTEQGVVQEGITHFGIDFWKSLFCSDKEGTYPTFGSKWWKHPSSWRPCLQTMILCR